MADEELRINIKVDQEKAAENTRQIKDAFSKIGDVEHTQRFEKLVRSFNLNEAQIKQLNESIGKTSSPLGNIASMFGKGGLAFLGITAAIEIGRKVNEAFLKQADRQIEIAHAAERMGITGGAQLEKNLEQMETVRIDRQRGMVMMETFATKRLEFLRHFSQFKQEIRESTQLGSREALERHFNELENALDPNDFMNAVRKFARGIREEWERRGDPGKGALEERKYLERWFGLDDLQHLHEDFMKVSKEEAEAFDRNLRVAREYVKVTTDISNNVDKIITSVVTQTLEGLGVMGILRSINAGLESAAEQHAQLDIMTPEERQAYIDKLVAEGDAAWRKGVLDWLKSQLGAHNQPQSQDFRQLQFADLSGNQQDLLTEEKRLVENLQILNAFLSDPTRKEFGPQFHNAPQGGARGESDPMRPPDNIAQPGGGAAAEAAKAPVKPRGGVAGSVDEALKMLGLNETKDQETLKKYMRTGGRDVAGDDNAWCARFVNMINVNARLPGNNSWAAKSFMDKGWGTKVDLTKEPVKTGDIFTKTREGGGHVGVATGNYRVNPDTGETEYEMLSGNIGENRPSTSKPGQTAGGGEVGLTWETLSGKTSSGEAGGGHGGIIDVRRGKSAVDEPYTGPEEGAGKGKRLDPEQPTLTAQRAEGTDADADADARAARSVELSKAAAANRPGAEFEQNIPALKQLKEGDLPTLYFTAGIPIREGGYQALMEGADPSIPVENRTQLRKYGVRRPEWEKGGSMGWQERRQRSDELKASQAQESELSRSLGAGLIGQESIDLPPIDRSSEELDRGRRDVDQHLSDQLDVKGKLNVDVEAPKGTEVKANGGGMFENNVSINRRIEEPAEAAA